MPSLVNLVYLVFYRLDSNIVHCSLSYCRWQAPFQTQIFHALIVHDCSSGSLPLLAPVLRREENVGFPSSRVIFRVYDPTRP